MPIDDPMTSARSVEEPTFLQRTYESFARTASQLSQRTQSIKERLIDYAEEETDDADWNDGQYDAPDPMPSKKGVTETISSTETVFTGTSSAALQAERAKNASLQRELAKKEAAMQSELAKMQAELAKRDAAMQGELAKKDAAMQGELAKMQSELAELAKQQAELEKKDAAMREEQAKKDAALKEEPVIVSNADVANAILAEKGITPPPKAETEKKAQEKKFKRPLLARISKRLFGRRKNKNKN